MAVPSHRPAYSCFSLGLKPWLQQSSYVVHGDNIHGSGAFSTVFAGVTDNGDPVAIKVLDKRLDGNRKEVLSNEVQVLRYLTARLHDHTHIVRFVDALEDAQSVYLVMEACKGWQLGRLLESRSFLTEGYAAWVVRQVATALRDMHLLGVVHRDVKPDNCIFADNSPGSSIKIIDFGMAMMRGVRDKQCEIVGSQDYVAPEVLQDQAYSSACDMWSLGIMAYVLLCGSVPFSGDEHVINSPLVFPESSLWQTISDDAKDFISRLLQKEPLKRPSAQAVLRHRWLQQHVEEPDLQVHQTFEQALNKAGSYRKGHSFILTHTPPSPQHFQPELQSCSASASPAQPHCSVHAHAAAGSMPCLGHHEQGATPGDQNELHEPRQHSPGGAYAYLQRLQQQQQQQQQQQHDQHVQLLQHPQQHHQHPQQHHQHPQQHHHNQQQHSEPSSGHHSQQATTRLRLGFNAHSGSHGHGKEQEARAVDESGQSGDESSSSSSSSSSSGWDRGRGRTLRQQRSTGAAKNAARQKPAVVTSHQEQEQRQWQQQRTGSAVQGCTERSTSAIGLPEWARTSALCSGRTTRSASKVAAASDDSSTQWPSVWQRARQQRRQTYRDERSS